MNGGGSPAVELHRWWDTEVTHALVNEENVKSMTKDLLNHLLVAEADFKDDLVALGNS